MALAGGHLPPAAATQAVLKERRQVLQRALAGRRNTVLGAGYPLPEPSTSIVMEKALGGDAPGLPAQVAGKYELVSGKYP